MAIGEQNQNLTQEISYRNKLLSFYKNRIALVITILVCASFILSLYSLIFSMEKVYIPGLPGSVGQNGQIGQTGQTGVTGQNGANGQNGLAGTTGAAGSFNTSGYHEETVCVRGGGQFDVFKSTHGGTGTCPSGDNEIILLVKN